MYNHFSHSEIYGELRAKRVWRWVGIVSATIVVTSLILLYLYGILFPREALPAVHAEVMRQEAIHYWSVRDHLNE